MSNDDRQHLMDFILQQQASFSSDMAILQETVNKLAVTVHELSQETHEKINNLTNVNQQLAQETHEAINNLTIANEVTRDLAEKAARLAIGVSQQLTVHKKEPHLSE